MNAACLTFGAKCGRFTEGCTSPCRRGRRSAPWICLPRWPGRSSVTSKRPRRSRWSSCGGKPEGERRKSSLLLHHALRQPIAVNTWNTYTWKPALAKAGVIPPRAEGAKAWQWAAAPKDGFHMLRHTYASIMLEAGEPVVTLARWLGHSLPSITLGYYAHFMPEAGSNGRGTIDGLLGKGGASAR